MSLILHEEKDFVICSKPVGVECERELPALLAEALGSNADTFYCIHRLDQVVGGVMVYARTASAAAKLSRCVQERSFEKEYLCVCSGLFEEKTGDMQDYLYKDSAKGKSFTVTAPRRGVKEASLSFSILAEAQYRDAPISFVHVQLHTGRFHQIRCQLAARRHPLLGDGKYGSRERGCTVALWSHRIAFPHPRSNKTCEFSLSPPVAFPWSLFPDTCPNASSIKSFSNS